MDIVDTNSDTFHRSALDMLCRICGNIARVRNPKRQHVLCVNGKSAPQASHLRGPHITLDYEMGAGFSLPRGARRGVCTQNV